MSLGSEFDRVLDEARAGVPSAWRELYRDLAPSVDRYLRARWLSAAEDVLGDTMVSVVRSLPTFDGGENAFRGWAFAIARNHATDDLRRRLRRPSESANHDALALVGPIGNTEEEAMRSLATARVREVLAGLTDDQREVLLLRLVAGLTIDEIALSLGRRPGAVKMLQARGISAIRRKISTGAVTL